MSGIVLHDDTVPYGPSKCAIRDCPGYVARNSKYCLAHKKAARDRIWELKRQAREEKVHRDIFYTNLWEQALVAGQAAMTACKPTPMVVEEHSDVLDDGSQVTARYYVEGGVCGNATVMVRPANCQFANWAKQNVPHARRSYKGGLRLYWVEEGGQSYERKVAFARAMVAVLKKAGIDAWMESRLD